METKDKAYISGLVLLFTVLIGGVTYQIYDTGNKIPCRTNKPIGWEILQNHDDKWFEAVCPYKTKPPIYANCSGFTSTKSYQRYYCHEIKVIQINKPTPEHNPTATGYAQWKCNSTGCSRVK